MGRAEGSRSGGPIAGDVSAFRRSSEPSVRNLRRSLGARQRQHFGDDLGGERRPAGLARLVAQKTLHPFLAISLLPAPHRQSTDADAASHFQDRQTFGRKENDPRALNIFAPTTAIDGDGKQPSWTASRLPRGR